MTGRSILKRDAHTKPADYFLQEAPDKYFPDSEVIIMKMFFVIYSEVADEAMVTAFKQSGFKAYTRMRELTGEGEETEPKLGTHYWPGNNNALMMAVNDEKIKPLCELVKKLKVEHPRAGLRAFTFPLEEECV
jgi:hypothetical protein